jgi:hypothetical protein
VIEDGGLDGGHLVKSGGPDTAYRIRSTEPYQRMLARELTSSMAEVDHYLTFMKEKKERRVLVGWS